ncbi:hypothetical protein ABZ023_34175 [Streptomyces sp. NPDC006367]|uniref:hypothetical protein n=1 Tax=unclassified Streptomyces TaxID=2593676 RepID=UPI0033AAC6DE
MTDAAADTRGTALPALGSLPGVHEGMSHLKKAIRLLQEAPERPGALKVVPQSRRDQFCEQFRRNSPDLEVCLSATCGRCAPIKAARA